jgi:hypothetical protein
VCGPLCHPAIRQWFDLAVFHLHTSLYDHVKTARTIHEQADGSIELSGGTRHGPKFKTITQMASFADFSVAPTLVKTNTVSPGGTYAVTKIEAEFLRSTGFFSERFLIFQGGRRRDKWESVISCT